MPEHVSAENLLLRLRWLERLRLHAAVGIVALTAFVHFGLKLRLVWQPLFVLAAVVIVYNTFFGILRKRFQALPREKLAFERLEGFANAKICLDLIVLTLVLHFSGGLENPFAVLYLVYPITAAILLTPRSAYLQAGLATFLLLALGVYEAVRPESHHHVVGYLSVELFQNPFFIAGEVVALAVAANISVYLASAIAKRLHQRERELREARDALAARSTELAQANEDLRALEERKSRFLSLAAHELRGPLAVAEGCLAVACDGFTTDPAKQAESLRRARSRIKGMLEVVRDILALAGTHKITEAACLQRVALDAVAQEVMDKYADESAARQVDLVFHPPAARVMVRADEKALTDAIGNLVSNAVKYTKEGGHVKVVVRRTENEAVCEVIDDGIGIPESEADKLFAEFYRAGNARASGREGTGLGLSLVKEIVEKHGGRIKIESLEGLGTCATIFLGLAKRH